MLHGMILRRRSAAVLLLGTLALTACKATGPAVSDAGAASTGASPEATDTPTDDPTADSTDTPGGTPATSKKPTSKSTKTSGTKTSAPTAKPSKSATASGPRIVSFKVVQKPKCAEGTAVFRAPAVPAIIKWKITGATGAALSVDDATHTAGTYGPEPTSGTETFTFQCNGPVGSTEKHTYAIYTVGGGKQRSLSITASAKVLDTGKL
jgi:hypothetical protein